MAGKYDDGNLTIGGSGPMYTVESLMAGLKELSAAMDGTGDQDVVVELFRVKGPQSRFGDFMIVLMGRDLEGTPVVGFHADSNLLSGLAGAGFRLRDGKVRWKPDEYRE
jgi:hypothetical protein